LVYNRYGIKKTYVGPQSWGALLLLYGRRSTHSGGYSHREIYCLEAIGLQCAKPNGN
jgi:hypothetical protein